MKRKGSDKTDPHSFTKRVDRPSGHSDLKKIIIINMLSILTPQDERRGFARVVFMVFTLTDFSHVNIISSSDSREPA